MNGRYTLVVVLLLGAFVFGLSTFVSDMFSEEPLAGSVSFAPSSVPRAGASAGGASSYRTADVPRVQMSGANYSLFHHHAASVPTYTPSSVGGYSSTPYIYIGSSSVAGSSDGQGAASSSAYGIYLTSSATTQSYGASFAASSASAYSYGAGGTASSSSASSSSVYSPASSVGTSSAFAYSSAAYSSANYASAQSAAQSISLSADQTLAARTEAPNRRKSNNKNTIEDTYYQWLQSNMWEFGAGADNLSEAQVRALWEALCADNEDFALTHTYDEFFAWFMSKQDDENFKWKLPIGDGIPCLLLLCVGYAAFQYSKQRKLQKI